MSVKIAPVGTLVSTVCPLTFVTDKTLSVTDKSVPNVLKGLLKTSSQEIDVNVPVDIQFQFVISNV